MACCLRENILPWYGLFLLQRRRKFSRWMTLPFWPGCIATSVIASEISSRRANAPVFLSRSNTLNLSQPAVWYWLATRRKPCIRLRDKASTWGCAMHGSWLKRSSHSPADIGTPAMLARYRDKRRMDSGVGRVFTDSLVRLFSNDDLVLGSDAQHGAKRARLPARKPSVL